MSFIILNFPKPEDKDWFLGQLSDGIMENMIDIKPVSGDFETATTFNVEREPDPFTESDNG